MSDEKITDPTVAESDDSAFPEDFANTLASILPPRPAGAQNPLRQIGKTGEVNKRKHYRHPVRWRVAIVNKSSGKNDIYHGRTYDVSMSGISILLEHNMAFTPEVVILLAIPPMHQGQKETILEIQCGLTHSVLDSAHNLFRLGMRFIHFKGDGKRILSDVLSKRHIPKQEPRSYTSI